VRNEKIETSNPMIEFLSPKQLQDYGKNVSVVIDEKNKLAVISAIHPHDPSWKLPSYEVDLSRIKTERDLLAWALHLSEKNWMTCSLLNEFIAVVGKHKRFKLYGL
jgi:hypothetical protein